MNPIYPPGLEWLDPTFFPPGVIEWQYTPLGFWLLGGWVYYAVDWLRG